MLSATPSVLIANVSFAVKQSKLEDAKVELAQFRQRSGDTAEALEALSWVARGELANGNLDRALSDSEEVLRRSETLLQGRKLDDIPHMAAAVGAAYEVQTQTLDRKHQKAEAVQVLEHALRTWHGTSITDRLRKNLNLLTLTGKPLPAIQKAEWLGAKAPGHGALNGKVVLVFFWAHWCPDCKAEAPILAKLASEFGPKGLVIIAPTKRYGYTASTENAEPEAEKQFIQRVFAKLYAGVPAISVPLDAANFERFGASTTPTLVLTDRRGIVRLYHPGAMAEAELRAAIESVIEPHA